MKKLEEIIEENIGDKKYLWIRIPDKKGTIFERQNIFKLTLASDRKIIDWAQTETPPKDIKADAKARL